MFRATKLITFGLLFINLLLVAIFQTFPSWIFICLWIAIIMNTVVIIRAKDGYEINFDCYLLRISKQLYETRSNFAGLLICILYIELYGTILFQIASDGMYVLLPLCIVISTYAPLACWLYPEDKWVAGWFILFGTLLPIQIFFSHELWPAIVGITSIIMGARAIPNHYQTLHFWFFAIFIILFVMHATITLMTLPLLAMTVVELGCTYLSTDLSIPAPMVEA